MSQPSDEKRTSDFPECPDRHAMGMRLLYENGKMLNNLAVQPSRWFTCTGCGGLFCDEVATMCEWCAPRLVPS